MKIKPRTILSLLGEAFTEWNNDRAFRLGAALAYYTVFALAPLFIIVIAIVGALWGNQTGAVRERLISEMQSLLGPEGAGIIQTMLENAERPGAGGVIAAVIGVLTLVIGATAVFVQLQDTLNTVWGLKAKPTESVVKSLLRARIISFGMILTIGFLLLVSLIISVLLSALGSLVEGIGPVMHFALQVINFLVSFGIITLLFAMMYRFLPDAHIAWHDVWIGAAITSLLFSVGKLGIGLYLGNASVASSYGAAGSLVVLLVWVFYSSLILIYGAEVTEVYARRFGSGVRPNSHAVLYVEEVVTVDHRSGKVEVEKSNADRVGVPKRASEVIVREKNPSLGSLAVPVAAAFVLGRLTKRRKKIIRKR